MSLTKNMPLDIPIKNSHNDYWCLRPFVDAYTQHDCNCFEADLIYTCDKFYLAHSIWQKKCGDFQELYLQPIYEECMQYPDVHLWIDIEFKSSFDIDALANIFKIYHSEQLPALPNMHYLVNVCEPNNWKTLYRKGRSKSAHDFYDKYNKEFNLVWKDDFREALPDGYFKQDDYF